jgi:two-component system, chemotaxis family, sensor kinase CheA
VSGPVDLREFVAGFLIEAEEHLRVARANLLTADEAARRGEASPRAVRVLFRSLHTMKGLAAMIGVEPIVDIAHGMEAVLRAADRGSGELSTAAVEQLLAGTAAIEQRVRALADGKPVPSAPPRLLVALADLDAESMSSRPPPRGALSLAPELDAKLTPSDREQIRVGLARGERALRADFTPSPARAEQGLTITTVRERVSAIAEIVKIVPLSLPQSPAAPGGLTFVLLLLTTASDEAIAAATATTPHELSPLAPRVESATEATAGAGAEAPVAAALASNEASSEDLADDPRVQGGVVRVSVERLDDAMEKLSALIVTRFRLGRAVTALAAEGADVRALRQIADEHARQIRDLRAAILKLRMVSMRELLEPLPLVLRGLRAATGKRVRLEIDAGKAELDKAVAERILPAIVHLVRNAVDHGIEPAEARRGAGKPEEGLVTITCFERSNTQLELSVADDGAGIDREAVARRAGRPLPRTDAGLLDLLALPGLSTRVEATKTSGRGLGVHIAKRITEELGGELLLRTTPGAGATFTLRVPLTVTIVDAFAFECGAQTFVVPVAMVEEIIDVDPARVVSPPAQRSGGRHVSLIERRGEVVPLVGLSSLFALPEGAAARPKAIVVRRNGEPFAFGVDRMLGQQEIVVRPLEDPLVKAAASPGVTDLGDGKPTLVLDLFALSSAIGRRRAEVTA